VPAQLPKCFVQMTQQIVGGLRRATLNDHALQARPLIIDAVSSFANLSLPRVRGVGLKHAVLARRNADRGLVVGGVFWHRSSPGGQEHQASLKRPRPKSQRTTCQPTPLVLNVLADSRSMA
jgi:hypothetical protein